jgi:hypothetical protein
VSPCVSGVRSTTLTTTTARPAGRSSPPPPGRSGPGQGTPPTSWLVLELFNFLLLLSLLLLQSVVICNTVGATLGPRESDSTDQLITITKRTVRLVDSKKPDRALQILEKLTKMSKFRITRFKELFFFRMICTVPLRQF